MKSSLLRAMIYFVGMLGALVISLGGIATAASIPAVVTLDPITDGLQTPVKAALDADGNIFVADPRAGGVVKLDKYGVAAGTIAMPSQVKALAVLNSANAIPGGRLLVAQETSVVVLRQDGTEAGKLGSGVGQFGKVTSIAVDDSGYIYVADAGDCTIKKFGADGSYLISFGGKASDAWDYGHFQLPNAVQVVKDATGTKIAVVDMMAGSIQFFSTSGSFLQVIGGNGTGPLTFTYPSGIAFEYLNGTVNRMYVVDMYQGRIQAIDPATSQFLEYIGAYGDKRGNLLTPSDIVFDAANKRLLVVNGLSNIVSFGIGNTLADVGSNPTKPAPAAAPGPQPTVALSVAAYPALTSQPTVTLTGTTDGSAVTVTNQVTGISAPAALSGSVWSYVINLSEGANALRISASRVGANTASQNVVISLDTAAPVLSVSSLGSGSATSNQVQNIAGVVVDSNLVSLTVNGQQVAVNNYLFSTAVALVKGENVVTVVAVDGLGQTTKDVRTITFNPVLPVISVVSPADGTYTNQADVTVSGSTDKLSAVKVNGILANPNGGLDWSASVKLVAGLNTLEITATDEFGGVVSEKRTVVFNEVKPTVVVTTPAQDLATKQPGVEVKGTFTTLAGVKEVKASINGVAAPVTVVGNEFSVFAECAAEGTYNVAITVTDLANNATTASRSIVYDLTPPALSLDAVQVPYPFVISGTVELGASLVVKDQTRTYDNIVTVSGEKWTANLSGIPYDAATLTVTATDAAGNQSVKRLNAPVPDGDVDGDGLVTLKDALAVIKIVVNNQIPNAQQLRGDIGPLVNGKANPKGKLEIIDAILILRKALNLPSWQ